MMTIYLHIGTAKTGTTCILIILSINKDILHKQGFIAPEAHDPAE